jgi:hypothetical protein
MDVFLTILFYVYLGLALSAPFLVIPAIWICHKLSNPWWKGLVVLIPLFGLPLFSLIIKLPKLSQSQAT